MSMMHHQYLHLDGPVVLHISIVLRKVPDISTRILPRRLPRKVNECSAEPHSPPGIDRATLSHITIYMRTLGQCTPWNLFLAKLWLKHPHNDERDIRTSPNSNIVTLCSPRSLLKPPAPRKTEDTFIEHTEWLASGNNHVRQSNNSPEHEDNQLVKHCTNLNKMIECSFMCLMNGNKQCKSLLNKWTIEEGPSLSDVAPTFFKPGHYEVTSRVIYYVLRWLITD